MKSSNLRAWLSWQAKKLNLALLRRGAGVQIGKSVDIHYTVSADTSSGGTITIGNCCQLERGVVLASAGGHITLGERVFVGPYCVLYGHGGLTVGQNTMIAAQTVVIPANHTFACHNIPIWKQPQTAQGVAIGQDCWIAAGVRILDGVIIGDGCVIGAGAVVTKSLPAMSIAVGVPARVIKRRAGSIDEVTNRTIPLLEGS